MVLEQSKDAFIMVDADALNDKFSDVYTINGGVSYGGVDPNGRSQQDLVDAETSKLGRSGIAGIAFVRESRNDRHLPGGLLAAHEAVHLQGIADRGKKYDHLKDASKFEPVEDAEARFKKTGKAP